MVYDKNNISIVSEMTFRSDYSYLDDSSYWLCLEVNNASEYYINFAMSNIYINGVKIYDSDDYGNWCYDSINPDASRVIYMDVSDLIDYYYESDDEDEDPMSIIDNGIESVSFTVDIYNQDGNQALSPEEITLTFD